MNDVNMMQLVLETGIIAIVSIAAAFMVYWNLLGKKRIKVTKQQLAMPKQHQPESKKSAQLPTPTVVTLGRASYQQ
jgi:hypothetical protein